MNEQKIGQRINAALAASNMKQKDLAKILGVTDNTISYYCRGARTPKLEQLAQIAKTLNVTTDYLLGLTDDPSPHPCAVDELGLSADAIQHIIDLHPDYNKQTWSLTPADALDILSWIISNIHNEFLLIHLSNLRKHKEEYQVVNSKLNNEPNPDLGTAWGDAIDRADLDKYRASKALDALLDYYIDDYCLHSIDHSNPYWRVIDDGND